MIQVEGQNQQAQQNANNQRQPLILIVEDDASLSKMYATKFKSAGFRVSVALDGENGLNKAATENPNTILLDMMLPKYSGLEFLEQLQQHPSMQNIPIIALTNLTEKQEADRAYKLGVKEYLAKAMHTPDDVVEKVKEHLGKTAQTQSSNNPSTQA